MTDPLWYKDAVVRETHLRAFFDSNDDGVGDFAGLTDKLDLGRVVPLPVRRLGVREDGAWFTGAEMRPATNGDGAWLFVGQPLKHLPVALPTAG